VNNVVYQLQDRWLASQAREATSRRIVAALADLTTALARAEQALDAVDDERMPAATARVHLRALP